MRAYMFACLQTCVRAHRDAYAHAHALFYACVRAYMQCVRACMHAHMRACMQACMHACLRTCTCVYVRVHACHAHTPILSIDQHFGTRQQQLGCSVPFAIHPPCTRPAREPLELDLLQVRGMCACTHMFIHSCVCASVCMHACTYACMRAHACVHVQGMCVRAFARACACACSELSTSP